MSRPSGNKMNAQCGWKVAIFKVICALALVIHASSASESAFRVPPGFRIEAAARPPMVRFPMFGTLDERGRLFVTESSGGDLYDELQKQTRDCRVSVLRDRNRDGVYDESQVFTDKLVPSMGLVWHNGKLFVADPPDLLAFEDTNDDGRADKKSVVLSGFGHQDNGSLHGLTIGPDGLLYMTTGQPDGYKLKCADGSVVEGKSGALLRCQPDGSEVEVLARGFENLVEVVFLPSGEIIGTDNWFRLPQEGIRDALVHLLPGGVYPLNAHAKTEAGLFYSGELLPAIQLYPAVAMSGLMRYTGSRFPGLMRGNLFSAQFNTRKVVRHELTRSGPTFESKDNDFVWTDNPDFHPSDVLQDADGSLLVIDTGSWYVHHCPTGRIRKSPAKGGIYRVRFEGKSDESATPENPDDVLARKLRNSRNATELIRSLNHQAAQVQLAATESLAKCGARQALPEIVHALTRANGEPVLTHALVYALHRLADVGELDKLLSHANAEVRRAALILLDQPPHRKLAPAAALEALKSRNERLRAAAITAFQKHPDWTEQATTYLCAQLEGHAPDTGLLRELVPLFATPEIKHALLRMVQDEGRSTSLRVVFLEIVQRCRFHASEQENLRNALRSALRSSDAGLVSKALQVQLDGLGEEYARLSNDARLPAALRLEGLRAVVRKQRSLDERSFELLSSCLAPSNSVSLRLSAAEVAAIASLSPAQFRSFLASVKDDPIISPSLVFSVAQKVGYSDELLPYLQRSVRIGWQIPDSVKQWLERSAPETELHAIVGEAAARLEEQRKELAKLEPLLRGGDPNRGHQVYLGEAGCAACHRVGKQGGLVGPDLTRIGAIRAPQDILESLVAPTATIAQGYDSFEVETIDGESLSGVQVRQFDDTFVLRDATGTEKRIDPAQIKKVERLKASLMPDGLLTALEREEIRDLLAYLQSLK